MSISSDQKKYAEMAGKLAMVILIILIIVTIIIVKRMNKHTKENDKKYKYDDEGCRLKEDGTRDKFTDGFRSSRSMRFERSRRNRTTNKCIKKGDNTVNYGIGFFLLLVSLGLSAWSYNTMAKYKMSEEQKKGPERPYLLKSTGKLDNFFRGVTEMAFSDGNSHGYNGLSWFDVF